MDWRRVRAYAALLRSRWSPERLAQGAAAFRNALLEAIGGFRRNDCILSATALAFATLFALVPALVLVFSLFSPFLGPGETSLRERLRQKLIELFLPTTGENISEVLEIFLENARTSSVVGLLSLILAVILLLVTIEHTLNRTFRAAAHRPPWSKFLAYWSMVTVAPILIGLSTYLSGRLPAPLSVERALEHYPRGANLLLAFLLTWAAVLYLYKLMPNTAVRWRAAWAGSLIATLLWLGLKHAFWLYLQFATNYKTLYGALWLLPVFLVWLDLSWLALLYGAELTQALQRRARGPAEDLGPAVARPTLRAALVLLALERAFQAGRGALPVAALSRMTRTGRGELRALLDGLERAGLIVPTAGRRPGWLLAQSLERLTLLDAARAVDPELAPLADDQAPAALRAVLEQRRAQTEALYARTRLLDLARSGQRLSWRGRPEPAPE